MNVNDLKEAIHARYQIGIGPTHRDLEHAASAVLAFLCTSLRPECISDGVTYLRSCHRLTCKTFTWCPTCLACRQHCDCEKTWIPCAVTVAHE